MKILKISSVLALVSMASSTAMASTSLPYISAPDGGATAGLLAISAVGLGLARKYLKR